METSEAQDQLAGRPSLEMGPLHTPVTSFRNRSSQSRSSLHLETRASSGLHDKPDEVVIGADQDDAAVELLDEVPAHKQRAWPLSC